MSALLLPDTARPANLRLGPGVRAQPLTSDLYDICRRIAEEVDPNLYILELEHDHPKGYRYIVMEHGRDGGDYLVLRLRDGELDARLITRLRRMVAIPFEQRLLELERDAENWQKQSREDDVDALYERVGAPMWGELERCGFIESRGVSFPKRRVRP